MNINLKHNSHKDKIQENLHKNKIFLDFEIIEECDIKDDLIYKDENENECNTIFNKISNYIRKTYTNLFIIIITGIVYFYYIYSYKNTN